MIFTILKKRILSIAVSKYLIVRYEVRSFNRTAIAKSKGGVVDNRDKGSPYTRIRINTTAISRSTKGLNTLQFGYAIACGYILLFPP